MSRESTGKSRRFVAAISLGLVLIAAFTGINTPAGSAQTALSSSVTTTDDTVVADHVTSLREAILFANSNPGTDTISFAIPGAGTHTIQPTSALPTITDPVVIDGYSQLQASRNTLVSGDNALLKIVLDGSFAGANADGLRIIAGNSTVRGIVVNRFSKHGIVLQSNGGNTIAGNYIGTDAGGTAALGNSVSGVGINKSSSNLIGGTTPEARNVISGNAQSGIAINGSTASGNVIAGNYIGTDAGGMAGLGNTISGVSINEAPANVIGGTASGARNVISGNGDGIFFDLSCASENTVLGNTIGAAADGVSDLGNSGAGIYIQGSGNTIGGTTGGAGNIIAFNGTQGVAVFFGSGNSVRGNSIFSNDALGLDLGDDGATANDAGDGDSGANNLQNSPVINSITVANGTAILSGILNSTPNTSRTLDFYGNPGADSASAAQGEVFVGSLTVTTDAEGNAPFSYSVAGNLPSQFYTATATGATGSTSEMSAARLSHALSINNVTVAEGATGTVIQASFTVSLSFLSSETVTVDYATADRTATQPGDYAAVAGTLVFLPGETEKTIVVQIHGDAANEDDEIFTVNLSNAGTVAIADGAGVGTIKDDDPLSTLPSLSIDDVSVTEGSAFTTTNAIFTVRLSSPSGRTVTVDYATANDTAQAYFDYQPLKTSLTFAPGQTTQTLTVVVRGDALNEVDETLFVNLSSAANATIADSQGVATITNDDPLPALSINDVSVVEGAAGATSYVTFTMTLSAPSGRTVTANYSTADGTATAPDDYGYVAGTVTFPPDAASAFIKVPVQGDALNEGAEDFTEHFFMNLSSPTNAAIGDGQGVATIKDKVSDSPPNLSIGDVSIVEGAAGATAYAALTVTLATASSQTVTVNFATANGTATIPGDYISTTGTLTWLPGQRTKTVMVKVRGDALNEVDETLLVNLSSAVNATIADEQGVVTITNDDPLPALSIDDVSVVEGAAGATPSVTLTVSLSAPSGQTVTVNYATANGTATAPSDYASRTGTLTWPPGQRTKTVVVKARGDALSEIDEAFFVNLSNVANATIADGQGIATITDDDPLPTLSITDVSVVEGAAGATASVILTVSLSAPSGRTVTVDYATANGTATAPDDYVSRTGTLTWPAEQRTKTVVVKVKGDALSEIDETFLVNLSNASGAAIADGQGVATITDDDPSG